MAQVFISYAKEDADCALALADVIRSRGWTVWWDPPIPYGDTWADVIERELRPSWAKADGRPYCQSMLALDR